MRLGIVGNLKAHAGRQHERAAVFELWQTAALEFKGLSEEVPFECKTSSLKTENGVVTVPTGPGSGIEIDPAFIKKHTC